MDTQVIRTTAPDALRNYSDSIDIEQHTTLAGTLTWEAEGCSDPHSRYYSRKVHVPGNYSGVTIGRGYDLKLRSQSEIIKDLTTAGIHVHDAELFAAARGLSGARARDYIRAHPLPEIGAVQEQQLFVNTLKKMEADVIRISNSAAVRDQYGTPDFNALDPAILEVLVDLRYRGDYTPQSRALIQRAVVENDLPTFTVLLSDPALWGAVPRARFEARRDFLRSKIQ